MQSSHHSIYRYPHLTEGQTEAWRSLDGLKVIKLMMAARILTRPPAHPGVGAIPWKGQPEGQGTGQNDL